jgi:hypothetical protein
MPIELTAPPAAPRVRSPYRRRRTRELLDAVIANPEQWVAMPIVDLGFTKPTHAQTALLNSARIRGVRIRTSVQQGKLYGTIVEGAAAGNTSTAGSEELHGHRV